MSSLEIVESAPVDKIQEIEFPSRIKCEFCDVTFKCDLDISRHLSSEIHTKNKDKLLVQQGHKDTSSKRDTPKNISQVFQLLRIKSMKDLDQLASMGYFKITSENQAILTGEISKCLLKLFVDHETKEFPPEMREPLIQALGKSNEKTPAATDRSAPELRSKPQSEARSKSQPRSKPQPESRSKPQSKSRPKPQSETQNELKPNSTSIRAARKGKVVKEKSINDNTPIPRPDSNYIPKLAKIKVEPK